MSKAKQAAGNGVSYADAGVDISAGNALVEAIKPLAKSTRRKGADSALGGFGGLFDLKACGFKDPVLVAANDGVAPSSASPSRPGATTGWASTSWPCR